MKWRNVKKGVVAACLLVVSQSAFAQGLLDSLSQDESKIVSSIAPYSSDMRVSILHVSQYTPVLVKLERTQARTSQSFQDLISSYAREEQEKFYQVVRFPELTSQLIALGKQNMDAAKSLVKDYPEGTQQPILDVYSTHFDDLDKINSINQSSQGALERITAKYSPELQQDFKKVIASPDVMTLLTDNIDLTVSLGESYKADPQGVINYLDSLNAKLTDQNVKDLDAYKSAVESNPKLQEEMKNAAEEYAQQNDQQNTTNPAYATTNYYGSAPYPYWFGYPYWYGSAMWYPTPFYYNTGFYYGANGGLVVFGLPSYSYSNWFFARGYSRYPLLYNHYNAYYNLHRTNITNVNVYRGFNTVAHNHFSTINRSTINNRGINPNQSRQTESRPGGMNTRNNFQQNMRPGGFNNNGFSHYNANSFHSMGWQNMSHGGGMSGGGMRMGGGGMRGGRH